MSALFGIPRSSKKGIAKVTSECYSLYRVKRRGIITREFRATSLRALDVENHLLPFYLQLGKLVEGVVLRLTTSPSLQPLFRVKPMKKTHKAIPLEVLVGRFGKQWGIRLENIESTLPYVTLPWRCSPKLCIQSNKQQAKNNLDKRLAQLIPGDYIYYTDGSAINKKVRAAVVAPSQTFTLWLFLGASPFYTIYSAELVGIRSFSSSTYKAGINQLSKNNYFHQKLSGYPWVYRI